MFRFEDPKAFQMLFVILFLILLIWFYGRTQKGKWKKSFDGKILGLLTANLAPRKRTFKSIMQAAVLVLMVVAWARPQAGQSTQEIKSAGVEIMLVVDVSESMMAEDVKPNRLEAVKLEMGRLIEKLPGHKIGVIAFAGSAALLSPLTNDPAALRMYLDSLSTLSVSSQGTAFERALQEASEAFERGGAQTDKLNRVTRVILMASDGEDQEPGAIEEAKKLTDKGIRIFTLAYGTEQGASIPQRDTLGFLKGYKKDSSNQEIVTKVSGKELKALAEAGKGSFYHSSFGGQHLDQVVEDINKLEKTEFESKVVTQYDEKFQIFLMLALILALIEILLGERRSAPRLWKGRFEVPVA